MDTYILGIESSCDETSASICHNGKILNNIIATQQIHINYGGVVPELASREHQKNIIPVVQTALKQNDISLNQLKAISVTQGPGLLGALLIGYTFAKTLSYSLGIPFINVHHMKAHIAAHYIDEPNPEFPFLCLTVSGGHTQIVKVLNYTSHEIIGTTIDDAVGEAFDKGAKLLGLPYPGGPLIDKTAQKGNPNRYNFSESNIPGYDFSYSGIKTSLLYFLREKIKTDTDFIEKNIEDLSASYQKSLINMLLKKLIKASNDLKIKNIALAGGVSANTELRKRVENEGKNRNWKVFIPKFEYCTDNAAMIAMEGYHQYISGNFGELNDQPKPRMSFED